MVYQALINYRRQSHFKDLEDKEVNYHLHVVALHNGMPQTKSKDEYIMAKHMDLQGNQERKTELLFQRVAFIESIKLCFPDDTPLVENMLGEVDTAITKFHRKQHKKRRPTQTPCYHHS